MSAYREPGEGPEPPRRELAKPTPKPKREEPPHSTPPDEFMFGIFALLIVALGAATLAGALSAEHSPERACAKNGGTWVVDHCKSLSTPEREQELRDQLNGRGP